MNYQDLASPNSEIGVISTLIQDVDYIWHSENLLSTDFYDVKHGAIYWALYELAKNGVHKIDLLMLEGMLQSQKAKDLKIPQVDKATLEAIMGFSEELARHTLEEYKLLVNDIKEYKTRRIICRESEKLHQLSLSQHVDSSMLENKMYDMVDMAEQSANETEPVVEMRDKVDDLWSQIESRHLGIISDIKFPFKVLNEYVTMEKGELVLFGGNAKSGKSAFLLTVAVKALREGNTVLVLDSELSDRLYLMRLLAHITGIKFKVLKNNEVLTDKQVSLVKQGLEQIKKWHLFHVYMPVFQDKEIMKLFRKVNASEKVDLLVLDYFKNTDNQGAFEVSQNLANSVNMVKNEIAGKYDIPTVGAVQLNGRGDISQLTLSWSQKIIYYCSTLVYIAPKTSEEIAKDGGGQFGTYKLYVAANRNGAMNTPGEYISIDFEGDNLMFKDIPQQPKIDNNVDSFY